MITFENNIFHASTKNTSYILRVLEGGYIEQLYYGKKIRQSTNYDVLYEKNASGYGNTIGTPVDCKLTLDNLCMEYSYAGTGDYRHLPLSLIMPDSGFSNDFLYDSYKIYEGTYAENEKTAMPYAKGEEPYEKQGNDIVHEGLTKNQIVTLDITMKDSVYPVYLHLICTIFSDSDVITRRVKLENHCDKEITATKVMSMMLDLPTKDYDLHTFDGLWIRERQANIKKLVSGIYVNDSTTGSSSNRHNPYIMLTKHIATKDWGDCYGFNLIYSGNHYEAVEVSEYGKVRIMSGINPYQFSWIVGASEAFYTPEAVLSYSSKGQNGLSHNMHEFINKHIIPSQWRNTERPILINNWEATYFDFNDVKLLEIAKEAKNLGMEMLVLDDGWFSNRLDDSSSLGDWTVNENKLGGSLDRLVQKVNEIGLKFGLWFEPEMISEKSDLYTKHPDWALKAPNRQAYIGRSQLVLDLTRSEVCDYIVEAVSNVLQSAPIEYVKWDMNRHITDAYSVGLGIRQGEFFHRYMLGLYQVCERLINAFPTILFEGCSSGGNRFDLGMLSYTPQIWTSDDTDANQRTYIQEGTSFGYPLSTMTAHVSAVPNHQTLRHTSIETRFNVACFGVLGYEIDITKLSDLEKKAISEQIKFYKKHRKLFQFGTFDRIFSDEHQVVWQVVSKDQKEAMVFLYQRIAIPNPPSDLLKITGLLEEELYEVKVRTQYNLDSRMPMSETEEYQAYGDMLMNAGIKLSQQFTGIWVHEQTRIMGDFASRIYEIKSSKILG